MKALPAGTAPPVIPVCLDQVWGGIFGFHGGRIFWKPPLEIPYEAGRSAVVADYSAVRRGRLRPQRG